MFSQNSVIYRLHVLSYSLHTGHSEYGSSNDRTKPHSTPATLYWLHANYELSEGVCIPRCHVYLNYVDYCNQSMTHPVNAASFGKVPTLLA